MVFSHHSKHQVCLVAGPGVKGIIGMHRSDLGYSYSVFVFICIRIQFLDYSPCIPYSLIHYTKVFNTFEKYSVFNEYFMNTSVYILRKY